MSAQNSELFLSLEKITIRVQDKFFFKDAAWQVKKGEQWLIYGPNGSGKSTFAKAIAGLLSTRQGNIRLHFIKRSQFPFPSVHREKITYISFDSQEKLLRQDSLRLDFENVWVENSGTRVSDFIGSKYSSFRFKKKFGLKEILNREIFSLSTGEMRKVFLVKSLLQNPSLLILDEPFDGLDRESKKSLLKLIDLLIEQGLHIICIVHRLDEIPLRITNVLLLKDCRILDSGTKNEMLKKHRGIFPLVKTTQKVNSNAKIRNNKTDSKILEMRDINVKYNNKNILSHIDWTIRRGENWAILGPNGAGKTTLLKLISGENLQAYANNIILFGKERTRLPLDYLRKRIGIISPALMLNYGKNISVYNVILSGFFDSIGLYRNTTSEQKKTVDRWVERLNLTDIMVKNYQELSFGQKRLILITRAIIKSPKLIIFDEPFNGLDALNRSKIARLINYLGSNTQSSIILVTHDSDEILESITHILYLKRGKITKVQTIQR